MEPRQACDRLYSPGCCPKIGYNLLIYTSYEFYKRAFLLTDRPHYDDYEYFTI